MTDRDITGDIRRTSLNRLPALLGISNDSLKEIADRVRQFDSAQSDGTRQRKALEKIALQVGQSILMETTSEKSRRQSLRNREVQALELMAVAQACTHEALVNTEVFQEILHRLGAEPAETREQGEQTRD